MELKQMEFRHRSVTSCLFLTENLDVSGVPGLGKTACLMEIINELTEEPKYKDNFIFNYINGLTLSKPDEFYSKLLEWLTGTKKNTVDSCKLLGSHQNLYHLTYKIRSSEEESSLQASTILKTKKIM
jgi:Cdc6-like AAA superfamily ATPase